VSESPSSRTDGPASVRAGEQSMVLQTVLRPTVDLIAAFRNLILKVTEHLGGSPDVSARVGLALHELLENSLKYSSDGVAEVTVTLAVRDGELVVVIKVANRVPQERIPGLATALGDLEAAGDPQALYQAMMQRTARVETGSGLGLARILAEGEMTLHGDIDGEVVSLVAGLRTPVR
jgi:hypothetical protein